ncbi:unnamed protein product [Paramecium primaurelia]|uniref:Insertion element IS150 protein InsJ-like helix-turn-helix domain-containing protein n=1 Tax=Paramecium primaurelia TaxID=5886 RepID=A0A8S1PU34_PARPR|nr:unnamed protein product [Paramecium primaurelia]
MKYSKISDETRLAFINTVEQGICTIKQAAKQFGIKFSTGKAILSLYKHEGRVGKKQNRIRKIKKQNEQDQKETVTNIKEETLSNVKQVQKNENGQNNSSQFNSYVQQYINYQRWCNANIWLQYLSGFSIPNIQSQGNRF